MAPPSSSASRSASPDLPLAVGPAIKMAVADIWSGPLIQPIRPRRLCRFFDQRGDRAGLVVRHPPFAVNAPEQIGSRKRGARDEFHAQHARLAAVDHYGFVARLDAILMRVAQDLPIGFQDRLPAEQ